MIFYLSTPLLIISGLPQTIRLLKRKQSWDISLMTYLLTLSGVILLFINSISVGSLPLIFANGSSLILLTVNTFLIIKYRCNV